MKSGNIIIEHVDTGCWIIPDFEDKGESFNISHITAFETHCNTAGKDEYYLAAYIHRGREVKLYTGTKEQCVRMLNKIMDSIMVGLTIIRVWKLAIEIDSEDENGSSQATIDATR